MKINSLVICTLSFFTHMALAEETALITKVNSTGFTLPENAQVETCQLFQNKVIVTTQHGDTDGSTSRKVYNIKLSGAVFGILKQAAAEPLQETENYLCDAPSTSIHSHYAGTDSVLFETGGCGSPRLTRKGLATSRLVNLITRYCPVIHRD